MKDITIYEPQNFDQAMKLAETLAASDLVPKDFRGKPGNVVIALQMGAEVGLPAMQAIQSIAAINGRPCIWGDALPALVQGSGKLEYMDEKMDGDTAVCKVKRVGQPEQVRTFSVDDAKKAGLFGKTGPWTQYPKRMLQMRARAFALRDVFPDVLKGLAVAEEVRDYKDMGEIQRNGSGSADVFKAAMDGHVDVNVDDGQVVQVALEKDTPVAPSNAELLDCVAFADGFEELDVASKMIAESGDDELKKQARGAYRSAHVRLTKDALCEAPTVADADRLLANMKGTPKDKEEITGIYLARVDELKKGEVA